MLYLKTMLIEGRYDSLVTKLSNKLLAIIKDSYAATKSESGEFAGTKIYYRRDETVPNILDDETQSPVYFEEVENATIPVEFYLQLKLQWIEGLGDLRAGGDAFNDTTRDADSPPLIEVRFKIDPTEYPQVLSEIAMDLRDTLRHEIEHLTQSGWNSIESKFIKSDQSLRQKIESGQLPAARYFTLPKEIDAMIQGLYTRAKKSRQPLKTTVDNYLNIWVRNGVLNDKTKQQVLTAWNRRLPALGIRQEL